ncbi:hypothetical protein ACKI1Q_45175, partial [Streptomyces galilaeus]|uniref:hypothetical protein n=1 Tax=Streptomyces galilaeus TaxID=33899 RepID=UPI0038F7A1A3
CDFADVLVFDNQCRNKEIIDLMDRAIKKGFSIVVWPSSTNQKQDINDIIKAGVSRNMLMKVLEKRTFSGIRALLELQKWKKA